MQQRFSQMENRDGKEIRCEARETGYAFAL